MKRIFAQLMMVFWMCSMAHAEMPKGGQYLEGKSSATAVILARSGGKTEI